MWGESYPIASWNGRLRLTRIKRGTSHVKGMLGLGVG